MAAVKHGEGDEVDALVNHIAINTISVLPDQQDMELSSQDDFLLPERIMSSGGGKLGWRGVLCSGIFLLVPVLLERFLQGMLSTAGTKRTTARTAVVGGRTASQRRLGTGLANIVGDGGLGLSDGLSADELVGVVHSHNIGRSTSRWHREVAGLHDENAELALRSGEASTRVVRSCFPDRVRRVAHCNVF